MKLKNGVKTYETRDNSGGSGYNGLCHGLLGCFNFAIQSCAQPVGEKLKVARAQVSHLEVSH